MQSAAQNGHASCVIELQNARKRPTKASVTSKTMLLEAEVESLRQMLETEQARAAEAKVGKAAADQETVRLEGEVESLRQALETERTRVAEAKEGKAAAHHESVRLEGEVESLRQALETERTRVAEAKEGKAAAHRMHVAGLLTCAIIIAAAVQVQFYLWHLRNTGWGNREAGHRKAGGDPSTRALPRRDAL